MGSRLIGICNRCGLCCRDGAARCINLIEHDGKTECAVYGDRTPNMPILMLNSDGTCYQARCLHATAEEIPLIIERGFNKGCSLEVEVSDG